MREARKHEANDFTKWLAEEENLRLLADEIGFDLKLVQVEADVGDFSADILAEEENTGKKIIIENHLELTNHSHLGQIITYASGYDAGVIVWESAAQSVMDSGALRASGFTVWMPFRELDRILYEFDRKHNGALK